MSDSRVHLLVSGLVQGVGYRYFAAKKAGVYGLKGFVRNLFDGSVEIIAEGEKGQIEEFIKELRTGPISAHVSDVRVEWDKPTFEYEGFRIL